MDWNPSEVIAPDKVPGSYTNDSLIILNQPIASFERLKDLWHNTSYRICADGGANVLHDCIANAREKFPDREINIEDYKPDLIHGDLDSIRSDVRKFYEGIGVRISQDDDQYCTDFAKCMLVLTKGYKETNRPHLDVLSPHRPPGQTITILSTMSGRIDQALGLLHEMLRETRAHAMSSLHPITLYFISESSISFVLPTGRNVIRGLDPKKGLFKKHAGMLPIYGTARITLEGFEWDVTDWETQMGGMVSTSNHIIGDEVVVEVVGKEVLFTVELAEV